MCSIKTCLSLLSHVTIYTKDKQIKNIFATFSFGTLCKHSLVLAQYILIQLKPISITAH